MVRAFRLVLTPAVLAVAVVNTGCGSTPAPTKASTPTTDKMGGDKMKDDKMGGDKMGGDKMKDDKMSGDKMKDDKMAPAGK